MADETAVKIDNLEANLEKTDNAPAPAPQGTRKADSVIGTVRSESPRSKPIRPL